jgi:hypothetical protein
VVPGWWLSAVSRSPCGAAFLFPRSSPVPFLHPLVSARTMELFPGFSDGSRTSGSDRTMESIATHASIAKRDRSASPSDTSTPRAKRAARRAKTTATLAVPRGLSTLSTDTAVSLPSLEKSARVKIQDYKNQSLRYDKLVQSSLNAFLTWLPEAGRTSLARDIDETSSDRQLYDVFMNLFTALAAPSKYVPFKGIS